MIPTIYSIKLWERQNYGDSRKVSGCQGLKGGEDE